MEVTEQDIARIPARNLHVPRTEFVAVWTAAERQYATTPTWQLAGVVVTCRWLARAIVKPETGKWYPARAPVTRREGSAYEELIAAEYVQASKLYSAQPAPAWLRNRPGWAKGIFMTLNWAWERSGQLPIDVTSAAAG